MAGRSFIKSIDCLFTYLVLALLFLVINAGIVACIFYLFNVASHGAQTSDTGETTTPSGLNTSDIPETSPGPFSAETMKIVQEMKKMMNMSVNPCNDFYNYACGGWLSSDAVKNGPEYYSILSLVINKTNSQLFSLLEQPVKERDPFYTSQVKKFFAACKNTDRLKERGITPFLDFVKTIGKFPLLDKTWIESDFNLQDVVTKLAKLGFANLFLFLKLGETDYIIFTPEPQPMKDIQEEKRTWTEATLQLLGVNTSDATVKEDIAQMFLLEEEIEKLDENVTHTPVIHIKSNILDLQLMAPWLNWHKFVQDLMAGYLGPNETITLSTTIIVETPDFFRSLHSDVIQNFSTRAVANFMMKTLLMFTNGLDTRFTSLAGYVSKLRNAPMDNRRYRCLQEVRNIFKDSLSRMYVDEFYDENKTKEIKAMLSKIKAAFRDRVNSSDWLSSETKGKIFRKIDKIKEQIGYPAYLKDDNLLNEKYKMIPTDEYFEAVPALARLFVGDFLQRSNPKISSVSLWPRPATSVTPFFFKTRNQIFTPAGGLHSPIFDFHWTSSMKYGVYGYILGHEIMHGFDREGHKRNENGDTVENYWTNNETSAYFKRADCFVNQYNNYKVQGFEVNGLKTLDENMCDSEGMRSSYKGYRDWITQQGKEEPYLSDIGLTHNQIFFVSLAQVYCSKTSNRLLLLVKDDHPIEAARVLGILQNSPEFSEAYGCKPESPMNPKEKCAIF